LVAFASTAQTHQHNALAALERFTAINSALEIDLFGQANLEWRDGRLISGVGGAPDFMRAALSSRGGRAIIALPASAQSGSVSRIVPTLSSPTVSLARNEADTVITEYGVAELKYRSIDQRAEALIAIAEPVHRERLTSSWRAMRRSQ
jgi:acyl-CoA hydrolase